MKSPALLFLASAAIFCAPADAADATAAPTAATMQEISPGIYQIGQIRLDQAKHSATFPGKVNMVEGAIEYLLVTTEGSTHESLLEHRGAAVGPALRDAADRRERRAASRRRGQRIPRRRRSIRNT